MTRAEIRLAVQERLRDTDGIRTTESEVNRLIHDGYTDIAERSGVIVRTATIACPAATCYITLPDDCLYPIVLRELGAGQPIDFVDWPYIDKLDPQFVRRSASYPNVAAMWGLGELLIYPAFAVAGQIEIIMAVVPDELADGDEPDLPEQHHQALIHYCHGRAVLKEAHGDQAGLRLGRAKRQMSEYQGLTGALEKWALDRQGAIRLAIYGDSLRKHDLDLRFPELRNSWRGPTL